MDRIRIYDNFIIVIDFKDKSESLIKFEDIHIIEKKYKLTYEYFYIVYVKTIHIPYIKKIDYIAEIAYISAKEYEALIQALDNYKNIR